jgi:hypothetical protein
LETESVVKHTFLQLKLLEALHKHVELYALDIKNGLKVLVVSLYVNYTKRDDGVMFWFNISHVEKKLEQHFNFFLLVSIHLFLSFHGKA